VFTPNIMKWQDKFYLFYTGVPLPFDAETPTAIGVATSFCGVSTSATPPRRDRRRVAPAIHKPGRSRSQ